MFLPADCPARSTDSGIQLTFRHDGAPVDPDRVAELLDMPAGVRQLCRDAAKRFLQLSAELARHDAEHDPRLVHLDQKVDALRAERQKAADGDVAGIAERLTDIDAEVELTEAEIVRIKAKRKVLAELVERERPSAERAAKKAAAVAYEAERKRLSAERDSVALRIARAVNEDLKELATITEVVAQVEARDGNQVAGVVHGWADQSIYG